MREPYIHILALSVVVHPSIIKPEIYPFLNQEMYNNYAYQLSDYFLHSRLLHFFIYYEIVHKVQ